jgi:hypothetical protein
MVTGITVGWSAPLNASEAGDVAFFHLATDGKKGSFDAKNATIFKLKSATYVPALNKVVLTPARPSAISPSSSGSTVKPPNGSKTHRDD